MEESRVLCCGCLCVDRRMILVNKLWEKQCFLQIIADIPVSQPEDLPVWLCWECAAYLHRFTNFKDKVKQSYRILHNYTKENLDVINLPNISSLQIQHIENLEITGNCVTEYKNTDSVKKENPPLVIPEFSVKTEEDNASLINFDDVSDVEDAQAKTEEKPIKRRVKLPIKNRIRRVATKKLPTETVFYKKVQFSKEKVEEERANLRSQDEYINALFKCERCIRPFPNADDLKDHIKMKHDLHALKHKCETCECSFKNSITLNCHMQKHSTRFQCVICSKLFDRKLLAMKHYEMYHGVALTCGVCQDEFGSQEDYDEHRKLHKDLSEESKEDDLRFPCKFCDKTFKWKTSLRKHVQLHSIENGQMRKPYCETCSVSFTSTINLQKHVKTSSKHQIKLKLIKLKDGDEKTSIDRESLQDIKKSVLASRMKYACHLCGRRFQWAGNLRRHKRSHVARAQGNLVCEPCNKTFSSVATFQQHMRVSKKHVSENDFKYTCHECDKKFANKTRLEDHINWEHLKKFRHTCDVCQKVFRCSSSLYLHKQAVHKKYALEHLCDLCGKAFANATKLRMHSAALHSAQAPFKCGWCSARFNWASCLSRHERVLHRARRPDRDG